MMKRIAAILIIYSFFILTLSAQQLKLDSLKKNLHDIENYDTSRVYLLVEISDLYAKCDIDSAMFYGKSCTKEALTSNKPKLIAMAYNTLGGVFVNIGIDDSAKYYHYKALDIALKNDLSEISAKAYFGLGNTYSSSNTDTCIMYYSKALDLFSEMQLKDEIASCYSNMALAYNRLGNQEKSFKYRLKSIAIFEELGNKESLAIAYNNIGIEYRNIGKIESAFSYIRKSISINKNINNLHELQRNYSNLAVLLSNDGKKDSALYYYNKSLDLNEKLGNKTNIAITLNAISQFYFNDGFYSKSLENSQASLDICTELNLKEGIMYNNLDISKTLYKLEQYKLADKKLNIALKIAENINIPGIIQSIYNELYKNNKAMGNHLQALQYFELSQFIKDSLYTVEKNIIIEELTTKYETEKKDILINEQKLKLHNERTEKNILYLSIAGLVLILLLLFSIYLIIRRDKKRISKSNIRIQNKNTELQELTNRIKEQSEELKKSNIQLLELGKFKENMTEMMVHDLKNPLSNIIGFADLDASEESMKYIYKSGLEMLNLISNILDVTKYDKTEMIVEMNDGYINDCIKSSIEQLSFFMGARELTINYQSKENNIAIFDREIINRVLINILSNAFKYSPMKGEITITCQNETIDHKEFVKTRIHNQGKSISPIEANQIFAKYTQLNPKKLGANYSTGIGLAFCKLAINAHQGEIGVEPTNDEGATFWFTLQKK